MSDDLAFRSISDIAGLLERGEVSPVELVEAQLERIGALDGQLNAYIAVLAERARADAAAADGRRRAGERGELLGVPVAVKDLFAMAGVPTTAGSRIVADPAPAADATAVRALRAAGAVVLGKTNMMEYAYGYPHPDYGETRNPWDTGRTAGGSSGGSAAAVAAGLAYGALGSDTGGSIRSPAAYCGIVGLKPTYGRVSRAGVVPLAWSLDHAGPLTRTVRDTALLFDAIAGYDPADPASADVPFATTAGACGMDVAGRRVGIVPELFERHVEPEVGRVAWAAVEQLRALGLEVVEVALACVPLVGPTITPLVQAEASAYHWPTLLERSDDYAPATRTALRLGGLVLAKDYLNAQRARRQIADEITAALATVDALVFPTQPIVAPRLDAYTVPDPNEPEEDVLDVEIGHTGLANLSGHPAVSVPCGLTDEGMPVGLQLTGRAFDEATILALAAAFERATPWHNRRPPVS